MSTAEDFQIRFDPNTFKSSIKDDMLAPGETILVERPVPVIDIHGGQTRLKLAVFELSRDAQSGALSTVNLGNLNEIKEGSLLENIIKRVAYQPEFNKSPYGRRNKAMVEATLRQGKIIKLT